MNKHKTAITIVTLLINIIGHADTVVAGWDSWASSVNDSPTTVLSSDFSASLSTVVGDWVRLSSGSTDLSFGSVSGAATSIDAATGALATQVLDQSYLQFTITNTGTGNYTLSGFHFDLQRQYSTSPRYYKVDVVSGSDITAGTLVNDQYLTATNPLEQDYADFDISLSSLEDNVLTTGESAIFRLTISGGNDSARTFIDNVAVTAVPEPVSLGLLSFGAILLGILRKTRV